MKNKSILYLAKGKNEKELSALLKRRALDSFFGEWKTEVTPLGKPIITEPAGWGISVAHSDGVVAVVIAPCEIGLDIELRKERKSQRLTHFFHESEKDCDFYSLWVKKEAYGKLTGEGVFKQKGKALPPDIAFTDLSAEVSAFAGKDFSAVIATLEGIEKPEIHVFE